MFKNMGLKMAYKKKTTKDYDNKELFVSVNVRGDKYIYLPRKSSFEPGQRVKVVKIKAIKSYIENNKEFIKRLSKK
jgi:hypothetical protein